MRPCVTHNLPSLNRASKPLVNLFVNLSLSYPSVALDGSFHIVVALRAVSSLQSSNKPENHALQLRAGGL